MYDVSTHEKRAVTDSSLPVRTRTHQGAQRSLEATDGHAFGHFTGNGLGNFTLSIYEAVGYDSKMQFVLSSLAGVPIREYATS